MASDREFAAAQTATGLPDGRQLIVVSNRQPYRHTRSEDETAISVGRPTGGLTAGLDPVMQSLGGTWIAWGDGDADRLTSDPDDCVGVPPDDPQYTIKRLWLSEDEVDNYYYGYSNQVLWPLCHSTIANVRCLPEYWSRYRSVNERFAEAVVERNGGPSLVWFHDYHLALAPRLVRQRIADGSTLMHFWHIPWPSWDVFRSCPHVHELLHGLLGNDVIVFHVPRYIESFIDCVEHALDEAVVDRSNSIISYLGNTTRVRAVPMGVPYRDIQQTASSAAADRAWTAFRDRYALKEGSRLALGIDRIDYTKGIIQRLHALEWVWDEHPEWRGTLSFVQKGSESRSKIPAYQRIQQTVEDEIDRINEKFGTDDWRPIIYTTEQLSREALYAVYRHASLCVVSSIRDGMNLVAQEYAAAQVDHDGVLLLSDQTGAHDEFGDATVSISPPDTEQFGRAIVNALSMPPRERAHRMQTIQSYVRAHDTQRWLKRNIELATASTPQLSYT